MNQSIPKSARTLIGPEPRVRPLRDPLPIVWLPAFHLRVLSGSMHERPWRAVQHDLLGTVRRVLLDEDACQNALRPGAVHDPFDFRFARREPLRAVLRVQYETAEVAKAVVDNAH